MGLVINFGLTGIGFKRRHEFGHGAMPKLIQIDLLFCTILKYGDSGQFFTFMRDYFSNSGAEKLPQYRNQVKSIKSKVRTQERKRNKNEIDRLTLENKALKEKYYDLKSETTVLINLAYQVRNIKDFDFSKIDKL